MTGGVLSGLPNVQDVRPADIGGLDEGNRTRRFRSRPGRESAGQLSDNAVVANLARLPNPDSSFR
jgi:hypothetical protein